MTRLRPADAGSATLEVAILAPALILLIGAMVVVGRIELTAQAVEHAAATAARDASLARTADAANAAAQAVAERELASAGCAATTIDIDATAMAAPLGEPATVTVTVSCTVDLSDLAIPALPGSRTLTGTAVSAVDAWRQR